MDSRHTNKKLWHLDLEGLSETRPAVLKVLMERLTPYQIPLEILQQPSLQDDAWPNSFSLDDSMCCLCHHPLSHPVIPQRCDTDGYSYLLTNLNPSNFPQNGSEWILSKF